jgi:hypothetical protein
LRASRRVGNVFCKLRSLGQQRISRHPAQIGSAPESWINDRRAVIVDESFVANLPDDLAHAKLEAVYEQFVRHGQRPKSFRGGRYSSGGAVHTFLREKQFLADASVVPYTTWLDHGAPTIGTGTCLPCVSLHWRPHTGRCGRSRSRMGFSRRPFQFWQRTFEAIENSRLRHLRLIGIADRLNLIRRMWLNFEDQLGGHTLPFLHMLRRLHLPCICFTVHSSSLEVGANGCYTRTEFERQQLLQRVEQSLRLVAQWSEFVPATVSRIAERLEENYHAHSRN